MDGTTNAPDAGTTSNSGVGSSGVESPSLGFSDHPSYLVAADIHSINNGQGSILNPSNWGSDVASVGEFAMATAVRAATSTLNIVPTVGNWFGANLDKLDTGDVLHSFDDNLGQYYDTHANSINIVGDVAASIIPGTIGIKAVQWGQRALALLPEGNAGFNMARSIGLLPTTTKQLAAAAVEDIANASTIYGNISYNAVKAFGTQYAQNALEMAAFETLSAVTMQDSPLFKDETAGDILYNALGAGVVGGGLMSGITAIQTRGLMKEAATAVDRITNPLKMVTNLEGLPATSTDIVVAALRDLAFPPAIPENLTAGQLTRATNSLAEREKLLWDRVRGGMLDLTKGDTTLSEMMVNSFRGQDFDKQLANVAYLSGVDRADMVSSVEKMQGSLQRQVAQLTGGKSSSLASLDTDQVTELQKQLANLQVLYVRLHGLDKGMVTDTVPEVLTLADKFGTQKEIDDHVKSYGWTIGDGYKPYDITQAANLNEAQARQIWARSQDLKSKPGLIYGKYDFPLQQAAYEQGLPAIAVDGVGVVKRDNFLQHLAEMKQEADTVLFNQTESGVKLSSTDELMARLKNIFGQHIEGMTTDEIEKITGSRNTYGFHYQASGRQGAHTLLNQTVINTDYLKSDEGWKQVIFTLTHEEGHSKSIRYFLAGQWDAIPQDDKDKMLAEMEVQSRLARPDNWKYAESESKLGNDTIFDYLRSPRELIADTYARIAMNSRLAEKTPIFNKYFSQEQRILPKEAFRQMELASRNLSFYEMRSWLDVTEGVVYDAVNPAPDKLMAQTANSIAETIEAKKKGVLPDGAPPLKTWYMPSVAKLSYNGTTINNAARQSDEFITSAMTYYKQRQNLYEQQAQAALQKILSAYGDNLGANFTPNPSDRMMLTATRSEAHPGMFTAGNSNYDSFGSWAQATGHAVDTAQRAATKQIGEVFQSHAYSIANHAPSAIELGAVRNQLLSTGEKYILERDANNNIIGLVLKKQSEYEDAMTAYNASGGGTKMPVRAALVDENAAERIPLNQDFVKGFLDDWVTHNNSFLQRNAALRQASGKSVNSDLMDTVYFPPPNPKEFDHYAFVVDNSIVGGGKTKMLWAKNDADLSQLIDSAKQAGPNYSVYTRKQVEAEKKLRDQYNWEDVLTQSYYDPSAQRTGAAAPFFPQTDGASLMEGLLSYKRKAEANLIREGVLTAYAPQIKQLRLFGQEFDNVSSSKIQSLHDTLTSRNTNPYNNYIQTMLNVNRDEASGLWPKINALAETAVGNILRPIARSINGTFKTNDQLAEVNDALAKAGIKVGYPSAATEMLANQGEDRKYLSEFIQKANGILGTLMLRADPLNALNNAFGSTILTSAETKFLTDAIAKGDSRYIGRLADISRISVPGTGGDTILSPAKLVASAYKDWISHVTGDPLQAERLDATVKYFKQNGWMSSIMDQIKESTSNLVLKGFDRASIQKADSAVNKSLTGANNWLGKWTGNDGAEAMNRFVSAHIMNAISDIGVEAGVIGQEDKRALINSFVNRTQGNFLASQRPGIFQGPLGQALGLFQTYQFNFMQQLFRHVENGNTKAALSILGMQTTIYGLNGLPAFQAINDHLIGEAYGNKSHSDIVSTTYGAAGKEAGDWILYGLASNIALDPDLKTNIYSRGDINPRQLTVIPSTLGEIPIVGAVGNFFGAIKSTFSKVQNGGDMWTSMLEGFEHAQISRPLSGLAVTLEGLSNPQQKAISTTTQGNIVAMNDVYSATTLARLVGAKPLDEAIARDALFRVNAYKAFDLQKTKDIGEAVKSYAIKGETPPPEVMNEFMKNYVAAGGRQENFMSFMSKTIATARSSTVNAIIQHNGTPFSQYMQQIMGGQKMQDMNNQPVVQAQTQSQGAQQ